MDIHGQRNIEMSCMLLPSGSCSSSSSSSSSCSSPKSSPRSATTADSSRPPVNIGITETNTLRESGPGDSTNVSGLPFELPESSGGGGDVARPGESVSMSVNVWWRLSVPRYPSGYGQLEWLLNPDHLLLINVVCYLISTTVGVCCISAFFAVAFDQELSDTHRLVWCTYLVFLAFRSMCELLMVMYRFIRRDLWINTYSQQEPAPSSHRLYYLVNVLMRCCSWCWLISMLLFFTMMDNLSLLSPIIISAECLSQLMPFVAWLSLGAIWPYSTLSTFLPFIPVNKQTLEHYTQECEKAATRGVDHLTLAKLPRCRYRPGVLPHGADTTCSICLADFKHRENIRILHCRHSYHQHCIDRWLKQHQTCPLCVQVVQPAADGAGVEPQSSRLSLSVVIAPQSS